MKSKRILKHNIKPVFLMLICLLVLFSFLSTTAVSPANSLKLTFIANEGVLIETFSHKVLIDALFDNPNPEYAAPSPDILEKMVAGQPTFDKIDLVLVTHDHPDHFSASPALRFLRNNPESKLVAAVDTIESMKKSEKLWESVKFRVIPAEMEVNSSHKIAIQGIDLSIFRTLHSGDIKTPWNLMFLLEMDGFTVLHEGDSDGKLETFEALGLKGQILDLALVHFWFPLHPVGSQIIQDFFQPEHIGLIHLPKRLFSDAPKRIEMIRKFYSDIFLLTESMESRLFHREARRFRSNQ
ncbi:MBL fold metallo-hydrolase [Acidobacteriota bacterium]